MCLLLKESKAFKKCEPYVDIAQIVENCKYDICSSSSQADNELYRCYAYATYAHECATKGIHVDWFDDPEMAEIRAGCLGSKFMYGKCQGGSLYTDCQKQENVTCRDLSTKRMAHGEPFCSSGCECPENYYFEMIANQPQCVLRSSCSCFDKGSNKYYQTGEKVKRGCSPW